MANKLFQKNDQLYAVITFTNKLTGALVNPTTVLVKVQAPNLTETTYTYNSSPELTRTSTGVYQFLLTLTQTGTYYIRAEGTGALIGAIEEFFNVDETVFA